MTILKIEIYENSCLFDNFCPDCWGDKGVTNMFMCTFLISVLLMRWGEVYRPNKKLFLFFVAVIFLERTFRGHLWTGWGAF